MNIIIYAAGVSSRMKEYLGHKIKALIDFGEKKLIDYQLSWVTKLNPEKLIIVIGQEHQILADHIGYNYNGVEITYVTNPDYKSKGNMLSLWHARNYCDNDVIFTTSDLLCNKSDILKFVKNKNKNKILIDSINKDIFHDNDPVKVSFDKNNLIQKLRKKIDELEKIDGIAVGIYQFDKIVMKKILNYINESIQKGDDNKSLYYAIDSALKSSVVSPVLMENANWYDVDTPAEANLAKKNIKLFN